MPRTLERLASRALQLGEDTLTRRRELLANTDLTAEARSRMVSETVREAELAVEAIRTQGADRYQSARRRIQERIARADDSGDQQLRRLEQINATQRIHGLLNRGVDPAEIIARARDAGDLATIQALKAEMAYLAPAGTLQSDYLDQIETELLPANLAAPRRELHELDAAYEWFQGQLQIAVSRVRNQSSLEGAVRARTSGYQPTA